MITMDVSTWTAFKSLVTSKALLIQYTDLENKYEVYAAEAQTFIWHTVLMKDGETDVVDFETNFKSTANAPLEIKAGAGRPERTVNSPQPAGTRQRWKGYQITIAEGQTTAYVDVGFDTAMYVMGGLIYSPDVDEDDSVTVDILVKANDAVYLSKMVDGVYLIPNMEISFMSSESMLFPSSVKFRITLTCATAAGVNGVHANVVVSYFKTEA
jgi:hypothetical protein